MIAARSCRPSDRDRSSKIRNDQYTTHTLAGKAEQGPSLQTSLAPTRSSRTFSLCTRIHSPPHCLLAMCCACEHAALIPGHRGRGMSRAVSGGWLDGPTLLSLPSVSLGNKYTAGGRLPRSTSIKLRNSSCGISQGGKSELITVSAGQSIDSTAQESPGGGLTETGRLTLWPKEPG